MAPPTTEKTAQQSREASPVTLPHVGRSTIKPDSESRQPAQVLKRASTTPMHSTTSPQSLSPNPSREASPIRPPLKPGTMSAMSSSQLSRSRKNSQDLSPHRTPSTPSFHAPSVPSAAAIQRALSVTGLPQVPSPTATDFSSETSKLPRPNRAQQTSAPSSGTIPPRLKSPPPALQHRPLVHSPRKFEHSAPPTPKITVEHATPVSISSNEGATEEEEPPLKTPLRTPLRGKASPGSLETVQESSLPTTPAISAGTSRTTKTSDSQLPSTIEEDPMEETAQKQGNKTVESGSDSAGSRATTVKAESKDTRKPTANNSAFRAPAMNTRRSFTHLKGRVPTEGSVKNMTVETETVSSVPQMALGGAGERGLPGRSEAGGSLRLKPSSETIRPKKEKKKPPRKTPALAPGTGGLPFRRRHYHHSSTRTPSPNEISVTSTTPQHSYSSAPEHFHFSLTLSSGSEARITAHRKNSDYGRFSSSPRASLASNVLTDRRPRLASSKADIFEAKVASAVGEADSEDSDETFVYESNPPEIHSGRPSRYHSRTPSTASMASQVDHWGNRVRQDGHHSIAGKKSMKFTNNSYHTNGHHETGDGPYTGGSTNSARTPGSNTMQHHHIGRHGRGVTGHPSLFDQESPFPSVAKSYRTMNSSLRTSRPSSPRNPQTGRLSAVPIKGNAGTVYDLEAEAADDERTPLVGTTRSNRNRHTRRPGSRNYVMDGVDRSSYCRRLTSYICLGGLMGFLIATVIIVIVMVSKPLMDVHIKDLQNVLASEQEIMLDMHVHAVNPNLVAIQVSDLDVFVYAKSRYVGTSEAWRKEHGLQPGGWENRTREGYLEPGVGISGGDDVDANLVKAQGGVDEGNDPIEDPEGDEHLMLLGSIYHFDSPLVFDASPIRHTLQSSTGELRLGKPGNSSEQGGTERWERVLEHPFQLIVRGVLHYSLPISSAVQSAKISGSIVVEPPAGDKAPDNIQASDQRGRSSNRRRKMSIAFSG